MSTPTQATLEKIATKLAKGKPLAFKLHDSDTLVIIGSDGRKQSFSQTEWQKASEAGSRSAKGSTAASQPKSSPSSKQSRKKSPAESAK